MKYLLRALTFALTLTLTLSLSGFVFADSDRSQDAGQDKTNKDDKKERDEKQKRGRLLAGAGELVQNLPGFADSKAVIEGISQRGFTWVAPSKAQ